MSFLKKSLSLNSSSRFYNAVEMKKAWDKTVADLNPLHYWGKQVKRWIAPALAVGLAVPMLIYGSKIEPEKVDLPKTSLKGQAFITEAIPQDHLVFERDTAYEMREPARGMMMNFPEYLANRCTDNAYTAHFMRAVFNTINTSSHIVDGISRETVTLAQQKTYVAYTTPNDRHDLNISGIWGPIAKSLEVAITKSQTPNGTIDLEDVFAISRLGEDVVNSARRSSGSYDWKKYQYAKDSFGKTIIPESERLFVEECLRYVRLM
jgi:hypothetical protein